MRIEWSRDRLPYVTLKGQGHAYWAQYFEKQLEMLFSNNRCCEAVRYDILATAWLLVNLC